MNHQEERSRQFFWKEYVDFLRRSKMQAGTTIEIHLKSPQEKLYRLQEVSLRQKQMQQLQHSTMGDISHQQKKAKQLV